MEGKFKYPGNLSTLFIAFQLRNLIDFILQNEEDF